MRGILEVPFSSITIKPLQLTTRDAHHRFGNNLKFSLFFSLCKIWTAWSGFYRENCPGWRCKFYVGIRHVSRIPRGDHVLVLICEKVCYITKHHQPLTHFTYNVPRINTTSVRQSRASIVFESLVVLLAGFEASLCYIYDAIRNKFLQNTTTR